MSLSSAPSMRRADVGARMAVDRAESDCWRSTVAVMPDGGSSESSQDGFKPTTPSEFRRRAVCKVRYGRATLTIRRWSGWNELIGDGSLSKSLDAYRRGLIGLDETVSVFIRSRIEAHSPTFSWEFADSRRLLTLVARCSTEPIFDDVSAEAVVEKLLATQDRQRQSVKAAGEHIAKSSRSAIVAMTRYTSAVARIAETVSLRQAAVAKAAAAFKSVGPAALPRWIPSLPTIEPHLAFGQWLSGSIPKPAVADLRLSSLSLSQLGPPNLSTALARITASNPRLSMPTDLRFSAASEELDVGHLIGVGRSAARLVGAAGDNRNREVLADAVSDVDEALENPALDEVVGAIERLSQAIEEHERRRLLENDEDATDELMRWVFAMLLAIYLALWPYLFRP